MRKPLKNEKGLTLVEVLAVIVIGSIILLLILNTLIFGQKQYKEQSEKARSLYDVTYAAKVITKEIRKADKSKIQNMGSNKNHIKLADDIEYKYNSHNESIDTKDGSTLVKGVGKFYIELEDDKVSIKIESLSNKIVETEIVLRRGG